ncbi:hypothetical protein GGQ84_000826 [Desulfitispora alkaliphila]|uniref:hypothetical protein n=1 Tax=Desulfitispora alkaliphila TaxID=622674 RepID=UPI003D1D3671
MDKLEKVKIEKVKTELGYIIESLENIKADHLQRKTMQDAIDIIEKLESLVRNGGDIDDI